MSQMTAPVLRTTPLHSVHAAAGAFFTDADGWRMPLRYSCAPTEHRAVRTSAGIFDLSHMGEIKVTGPGAAAALDRALVGRVSTVALGRSLRTMMVTGAGGVIDVLMVHHVGEHEYMVVSGAGNRKRVVAELARRRDGHACTIDDISTATALITVQGPRTTEVLSGAVESGAGIPAALHPRETGSPTDGGDCGPDVLCGSTLLRRLRRQGHHAVGQVLPAVREKIGRHGRELEASVAHVHGAIDGRRVLHPLQAEPALDDGRGVEDALFKLVDRPGQGGGEVGNHVSGSFAAGREKGPDSSWRILGREMPAFCERLPGAQSCKRLSAGAKKAAKRTASCGQAVNRPLQAQGPPCPLCLPAQFCTSKTGANFTP